MHVQSEKGRVTTKSRAAKQVRMKAQMPGPSGSAGKKMRKRRREFKSEIEKTHIHT